MVAVTVALLGLAVTVPFGQTSILGDEFFKVLIVRSGSMEPTIPVGSLIVAQKQNQYGVGEIVTFKAGGEFVTHRIVAHKAGQYTTQGDANASLDSPILPSSVIGKVSFALPYAGYVVNFVKTPLGFSLLIILPALFIVIQEILAIGRELEREKERRKARLLAINNMGSLPARVKFAQAMDKESAAAKRKVAQAFSLLLVALVSGLGGTKAYFSDMAVSAGNTFTAGTWGPQIANYLVINEVYYDPDSARRIGGHGGVWVEIYNPTDVDLTLVNWSLWDASQGETLNATIPAKGFLIISGATQAELRAKWPGIPLSTVFIQAPDGKIGNGLDSSGERLALKDSSGATIDAVSWGNDITYLNPAPAIVAQGRSMDRVINGADTNTAADFFSNESPDPGS